MHYMYCFKLMLRTVPKVIDFPRYNMKCSGENVILRGIVHVVSGFPLYISCSIAEIWIAFLTGSGAFQNSIIRSVKSVRRF